MVQFQEWPKTMRLYRDIVVSEKIDGTNSGIHVVPYDTTVGHESNDDFLVAEVDLETTPNLRYALYAQSRKRLIRPGKGTDNYGFAEWVRNNAEELVCLLGAGVHFGEWWGVGIQRNYGVGNRRFSLFNTSKWENLDVVLGDIPVRSVPVLYRGVFSDREIKGSLADLAQNGSWAAPGFDNPEGVCVWHSQTRNVYKVTLDNEDTSKWGAFT